MAAPDTDDLLLWMGVDGVSPTSPLDARLTAALAAAVEDVEGRCLARFVDGTETYPEAIRTAILIMGARLYKRSDSPEGVAGFDATGDAFRILGTDVDVERLISRYRRLDGFS